MKGNLKNNINNIITLLLVFASLHIQSQTDVNKNYVRTINYDENGNVIGETKSYFDFLGKTTQVQSKVLSDNNIIAAQTIYDDYGREVIETLPAPIEQSSFLYKDKFVTNPVNGDNYTTYYFNRKASEPALGYQAGLGMVNTPFSVGTDAKTLGYYYSDKNVQEQYVPASGFPYSRVEYDDNNLGAVKRASAAGEQLNMGSGHEAQNYAMVSFNELDYLYGKGKGWIIDNYVDNNNDGQGVITPYTCSNNRVVKTISVDQNGVESVVFSSVDGKILASCLSGQENGANVKTQQITYTQPGEWYNGAEYGTIFMDVHLPKGCENSLIITNALDPNNTRPVTYKILNLKTGEYVKYGNSIQYTGTQPNLPAGYYRITWLSGGITKNYSGSSYTAFAFKISQTLNYYNFTINYYDKAGRSVLSVPPAGVDYSYVPSTSSTPVHTMISSVTYNSINQMLLSVAPDVGKTQFIYRSDGQVRFSQNAKQANASATSIGQQSATVDLSVATSGLANNYQYQYIFPASVAPGATFNVTLNFVVGSGGDVPAYRSDYTAYISPLNGYIASTDGVNYSNTALSFSIPSSVSSNIVPQGQIVFSTTFSMKAPNSSPNLQFCSHSFNYFYHGGYPQYGGGAEYGRFQFGSILPSVQMVPKFSYINYDNSGRPVETGEYDPSLSGSYTAVTFNESNVTAVLDNARCTQQNYIMYDNTDITYSNYNQLPNYLLGKVTKTWNANNTTWYGYDELGRVSWMVKNIANLPISQTNGYVSLNYNYDLNGNLTKVAFQKENTNEDFYHFYEYDKDKRLKKVYTSIDDGVNKTEQAEYFYYRHGPLKRVELANKTQGLDYIYTINGWLKSINAPELNLRDPGKDGTSTSANHIAKDMFALTLDYFAGDYNRTNTNIQSFTGGADLYNGIIKDQRWQTQLPTAAQSVSTIQYKNSQLYYGYTYDKKYQLTTASFSTVDNAGNLNGSIPNAGGGPLLASAANNDYKLSGITYDLNGNILTLNRNGCANLSGGLDMDQLAYTYNYSGGRLLNNKLKNVVDAIATNNYTGYSFKAGQTTPSNTYVYDEIGELTADNSSDPAKAGTTTYDVYGKVTRITLASRTVNFYYDENGQRVKKSDGTTDTWYVRDVAGNVISIYETTSSITSQKQLNVYASNRVGTYTPTSATSGNYLYELTDHLGNVRSTFSLTNKTTIATSFDGTGADDYIFGASSTIDNTIDRTNTTTNVASVQLPANRYGATLWKVFVKQGQVITGAFYTYCATGTTPQGEAVMYLNNPTAGVTNAVYKPLTFNAGAWTQNTFSYTVASDSYFYFYVKNNSTTTCWVDELSVTFSSGGGVPVPVAESFADYYPHGSVLPGREYNPAVNYRYGYQGQFAEEDTETGLNSFELRNYDALLGRWSTIDPYGQYSSPYNAMGNNPVNFVDPTGGEAGEEGPPGRAVRDKNGNVKTTVTFEPGTLPTDLVEVTATAYVDRGNGNMIGIMGNIVGGIGMIAQSTELVSELYMFKRTSDFYNAAKFTLHPNAMNLSDKSPLFANKLMSGSKLMNVARYAKGIGVVGNLVGVGLSVNKIASGKGDAMDWVDIGVNSVGIYAVFALASNPVGWVIGGASVVYGGYRLYQELSKQ